MYGDPDCMSALAYRRAHAGDAEALARLEDMASDGLAGEFWALMAKTGQTPLEAGTALLSRQTGVHTFQDAIVCQQGGAVAGMVLGYQLDPEESLSLNFKVPDALVPIFDLEAQAAGCWHIDSLCVLPASRRQGIATALLKAAQNTAQQSAARRMSLIVADRNHQARRLYERHHFAAIADRPIIPINGWRQGGRWLLMVADPLTADTQE